MRIRSIKPEFWRSDDIAALDMVTRLFFIGLWSYVDDHGRGRDNVQLIVADLFALDPPRESFANVSRGLSRLEKAGLIGRYNVAGKHYIHVVTWTLHQRVDKPQESRFPEPPNAVTSTNSDPEPFANDSRITPEPFAPGAWSMEQGSGSMEHGASTPPPQATEMFDLFYQAYPRKVGRAAAQKAFAKAAKAADPQQIIDGAARLAADPNRPDEQFVPYPATWLNHGQWTDGPCAPRGSTAKPGAIQVATGIVAMAADLQRIADGHTNGHAYQLEINR